MNHMDNTVPLIGNGGNDAAVGAPSVPVTTEPVEKAAQPGEPARAKKAFKLAAPLIVDGKALMALELDFDKLSAADMLNIEQDMMSAGVVAMKNAAFSSAYCLYIAARACGININDLKRLSFRDSDRLVQETQNFMLASASTE